MAEEPRMQAVLIDGLGDLSKCPHDRVMATLKADPGILQRVPDSHQHYFRWALLHKARSNPAIFSPAIADDPESWAHNPLAWDGAWEEDGNFLVQAVGRDPALIHYVPDAFRGRLFVREAVAANTEVIKLCLSANNPKQLVLGALQKTPEAVQALPEGWHHDLDLLAAAISANPEVCKWIPSSELQGGSGIFLNAVSKTWESRCRLKELSGLCCSCDGEDSDREEHDDIVRNLWGSSCGLIMEYLDAQGFSLDWAEHFINEQWELPDIPGRREWDDCLDSFTVGKHVRILEQALQYLGGSSEFAAEALQIAKNHVKNHGLLEAMITRGLKDHPDAVKIMPSISLKFACKALATNPKAFTYLPASLTEKREFIVQAMASNPEMMEFLPRDMQVDSSLALEALGTEVPSRVRQSEQRRILSFLPDELRFDRDFALAALERCPRCFSLLPFCFHQDLDFIVAALFKQPSVFAWLPEDIRQDRQLMAATSNLWQDRDTIVRIVPMCPEILRHHVPDSVHEDKSLILQLVEENHECFWYISFRLRRDKQFVLEALGMNSESWRTLPDELQKDQEFILDAIERQPQVFNMLDEKQRGNADFAMKCLKKTAAIASWIPRSLLEDLDFAMEALHVSQGDPDIFKVLGRRFWGEDFGGDDSEADDRDEDFGGNDSEADDRDAKDTSARKFALKALQLNVAIFELLPGRLQDDSSFVADALKTSPSILQRIPRLFADDVLFLEGVFSSPEAIIALCDQLSAINAQFRLDALTVCGKLSMLKPCMLAAATGAIAACLEDDDYRVRLATPHVLLSLGDHVKPHLPYIESLGCSPKAGVSSAVEQTLSLLDYMPEATIALEKLHDHAQGLEERGTSKEHPDWEENAAANASCAHALLVARVVPCSVVRITVSRCPDDLRKALYADPSLARCHDALVEAGLHLPPHVKFFLTPDLCKEVLKAPETANLRACDIIVSRELAGTVEGVIASLRSNSKVRVKQSHLMSVDAAISVHDFEAPVIVKNTFIQVQMPSSLISGIGSNAARSIKSAPI